jgi:hypothetical protein
MLPAADDLVAVLAILPVSCKSRALLRSAD